MLVHADDDGPDGALGDVVDDVESGDELPPSQAAQELDQAFNLSQGGDAEAAEGARSFDWRSRHSPSQPFSGVWHGQWHGWQGG